MVFDEFWVLGQNSSKNHENSSKTQNSSPFPKSRIVPIRFRKRRRILVFWVKIRPKTMKIRQKLVSSPFPEI